MTDEHSAAEHPKPKKHAHAAAADAAVAVSVNALHELLDAAEKHADADERLTAAIAHFQL